MRAISGFLGIDDAHVTEGSIRFLGRRIENRSPQRISHLGMVLVPERDKVFANLTVAENWLRRLAPPSRSGRPRAHGVPVLPEPRRAALADRRLLSGGERQMLAIASALICQPKLLLVDELSLGLAPVAVEDLMRRLSSDPPRAWHHDGHRRAERGGWRSRSRTTAT